MLSHSVGVVKCCFFCRCETTKCHASELVVFAFPSLRPGATAGVAFHSIPVATTAQLLCWASGEEEIRRRERCSPVSAVKQGAKSPSTSWYATWIWLDQTCMIRAVWKWRWMDSPFSRVSTVDTTVVSALHANGEARRNAARRDGVALEAARWRKERTHPELTARGGRAGLSSLVLRWVAGGRPRHGHFLAHGRARSESFLMRKRVEQAWRLHWGSSCPVPKHWQWPCLCWTSPDPEDLMEFACCLTMWNGTSNTRELKLGEWFVCALLVLLVLGALWM